MQQNQNKEASSRQVEKDIRMNEVQETVENHIVESAFNHKNTTNLKRIERISLLGERNSGTRWVYNELNRCFNQTSLAVKRGFSRYKHWFQYEGGKAPTDETLIIAQFRDPYYWTEAMRKKPHHATEHMFLEWEEFVTKPWTMPRVGLDLEVHDKENVKCQQHFQYNDIVSCLEKPFLKNEAQMKKYWSGHRPFYEMRNDHSGQPYNNILEMRTDKIRNFLDMKEYKNVQDHVVVQYEQLVRHGTGSLIRHIEAKTGVKAHCQTTEGQREREKRTLDPLFVEWISEYLDWKTEALIGYNRWE